jgi:small subunit ribosomal protein S20
LANHKSALKRVRQSEKKRMRNKSVKTSVKKITKSIRLAAADKLKDDALIKLDMAKSTIDKAAKKGTIHKKTASRKISRLSRVVNTISA